jgi:ribosome-binding protein aMBF1 (putative translation factor)
MLYSFMKKNNLVKFSEFKSVLKESLKDPKFRKEYDKLGPKYDLIRQVIEAKNKLGLTQKELAGRMGTKQSALARFESGNINPTLNFMQKLAKALNTTFRLNID